MVTQIHSHDNRLAQIEQWKLSVPDLHTREAENLRLRILAEVNAQATARYDVLTRQMDLMQQELVRLRVTIEVGAKR